MASEGPEVRPKVTIRRIVVGFDAGAWRVETLREIAALAAETESELLGVLIEDTDLLQLARLPFAAEVGYPSAVRRGLDVATLERGLRARAETLRRALAAALEPARVAWSLRVAREAPPRVLAAVLAAALAEGRAPALLIPPRGQPRAARRVVRAEELSEALLREMIAAACPLLVLPREDSG